MSKEDTSSGLLSKMVKFVRNPATSWSDLDNKETDRDEAMSKQLPAKPPAATKFASLLRERNLVAGF